MNVQEYIASGILESYLLGELTDKEREEVEAMAREHPEVEQELKLVEETLERTARETAITPPPAIGKALMQEFTSSPGSAEADVKSISQKPGSALWKLMAAAAVILAIVSSVLAVNYWNKWQLAETRLSDLITQNQLMVEQFNQTADQLALTSEELRIVVSDDFRKVTMNPTQDSGSRASVYWNNTNGRVFLHVSSLPQPPPGKQYQLWALVDGQPIDAGVFDLPADQQSLLEMNHMDTADAFAITLEPAGGSEAPTLEDLQVIGNV